VNVEAYYKTLTKELESLKDRVRNFIEDKHWLTDGEWKESVLRSFLRRNLPEEIKVGRGFILTNQGPSTQCDILIYRASFPVMFREGELVFITADAVLGVIEVKSVATKENLRETVDKFVRIGLKMKEHRGGCFFALFSYQSKIKDHDLVLQSLAEKCDHRSKVVDLLSLGCTTFIKWWEEDPTGGLDTYPQWHSYNLKNMAAGYFITNVVDFVSPASVDSNNWLWFPEAGKETKRTGSVPFRPVQGN
jgi:hypothetical protein